MRKLLLIVIVLNATVFCLAQKDSLYNKNINEIKINEADSITIKAYDENDVLSIYSIIQTSFLSFDDPTYLAPVPYITSTKKRRIELRENEKSITNLQFLEANINLRYIIASGRESSKGFYRRMRGTIDYHPLFRMYLNAKNSNPTTPSNQDIGLGYDLNLFNSSLEGKRKWLFKDGVRHDRIVPVPEARVKLVNLYVSAAHYSNGQEHGVYYVLDSLNNRNDYRQGDFSTNYVRIMLTYGLYNYSINNTNIKKHFHKMFQAGLGLQRDGKFPGGFTKEQNKKYGKLRCLFKFDYRFGPKATFSPFDFRGSATKINYVTGTGSKIQVNRLIDNHILIKSSYIIGNLQEFTPNILNDNSKYRWNLEIIYEAVYYRWRNLGLFAKYYVGRDYLNIRYDDIVHIGMIGFTASFKKYRPAMWLPTHANF